MDAKKTGALIAERRKAHGLTQKELAGRLMVSDKAVSKWETGAGYPEVTLLPLLAETLGITVDELLAGELRADAPEPEPAAPQPSDIQRAYAAEKLADADDKLLFAGVILSLVGVYYLFTHSYSIPGLPIPLLGLVLLVMACYWHRKSCRRLHQAYAADIRLSCRREKMLTALCGGIWLYPFLRSAWFYGVLFWDTGSLAIDGLQVWSSDRFDLFLRFGYLVLVGDSSVRQYTLPFLWQPPLIAGILIAVLSLAYRRMDAQTRFHPVCCALPLLLPLLGAGVVIVMQMRIIIGLAPENYNHPLYFADTEIEQGLQAFSGSARMVWTAATVILLAALWLARRKLASRAGALACGLIAQCYVGWLLTMPQMMVTFETLTSDNPYCRGAIYLYLVQLLYILLLCVLCWAICTLLSGLRRRQKQPAAPASGAQPYS